METTNLKLAMAALFHDIGKFSQGGMSLTAGYRANNEQIFQPLSKGNYSHQHALYTAAFIEEFANDLPDEFNQAIWGDGDSFITLAGCHHKPESAMQQCITQADCLSSGLDRANFTDDKSIHFSKYRSTRLVSILEALSPEEKNQQKFTTRESYTSHYELKPLSAHSIFPVQNRKISKPEAKAEYQQLFDDFITTLKQLHHQDSPSLWSQHFDSLFATYCSHIPAARVNKVVPDVSLYDHCRTTAALAVPLYMYHKENNSLTPKAIQDNQPDKFLLVSGDFYGIQDFIFAADGEHQQFRAKLLRGRSFAVSLFSELAADLLCKALSLPFTAVFLNAAGKFHILTANTKATSKIINQQAQIINNWLIKISQGQASMGLTTTPTSPDQFTRTNFIKLWETHLANMDRNKYQRIDLNQYGVVDDFLDSFNNELDKPLCPFCGKRPSAIQSKNDRYLQDSGSACNICRDHIMLGTNLVKGHNVAIFKGSIKAKKHTQLLEPIFATYQLQFFPDIASIDDGPLVKFWQLSVNENGSLPTKGTLKLINGYVPIYRENDRGNKTLLKALEDEEMTSLDQAIKDKIPKTFNILAALAKIDTQGTEALGVLKADVDNLGRCMSCGMADDRFTISRMATLSRRLEQFFTLYLPHMLASQPEFENVYTVFAGGDDLFLIGPWNCLADLAQHLRSEWHHFVSGNDSDGQLTFSVGITMHKAHDPVNKLASIAEEALEQAKDNGRNSITMFKETVKWSTFKDLRAKQTIMEDWLAREYISSVMLYRFNLFINMADKAKRITDRKQTITIKDMECFKWRALLKYSLERNIKKRKNREKALREVSLITAWLEDYGSALKIPLWSQLYAKRQ